MPAGLAWTPVSVEGFTPRAAAVCHAPAGGLLAAAGLVSGPEREHRGIHVPVFAGEILVAALPDERPAFEFAAFSTQPGIAADLVGFWRPRELTWAKVEEFVLARALDGLESLQCLDRYTGKGVAEDQVKTTIRLTFRADDRTLSQDEVNRQVQGLAEDLRKQLHVQFAGA